MILRAISLIILSFIALDSMAAYHLHIERETPITLEEWKSVLDETDNVRITDKDAVAINPMTQEEIRIVMPEGSAEVYFPETKEWIIVFTFSKSIYFNATAAWNEKNSHIRNVAFQVANGLSAKIIGDEGEEYFEN